MTSGSRTADVGPPPTGRDPGRRAAVAGPGGVRTYGCYSSQASMMICREIFPSRSVIIDSDITRTPSAYSQDSL